MTDESRSPEAPPVSQEKIYLEEDEINLYEYFLVLKKRYKLIVCIILVSVLITGIISYMQTPIYEITTSISPGYLEEDEEGNLKYVDNINKADFVAIAGGEDASLAIKGDGSIAYWGYGNIENTPDGTNFIAIAGGDGYSLALTPEPTALLILASGGIMLQRRRY